MPLSETTILKKKPKTCVLFSLVVSLLLFSCYDNPKNPLANAAQYTNYCGSCHLTPDPTTIPWPIWENDVLPEMAARMGYRYDGYDPYSYKSREEKSYMNLNKTYPEQPTIDYKTWWGIHDYIRSLAPYTIPIDTTRKNRNKNLTYNATTKINTLPLSWSLKPTYSGSEKLFNDLHTVRMAPVIARIQWLFKVQSQYQQPQPHRR